MTHLIRTIEDVKKALEDNKVKIFGLGGYPSTRSEVWPLTSDPEVVCANAAGEIEAVRQKLKVSVFPQEESKPFPIKKPEKILKDQKIVDYLKQQAKISGKKLAIYLYKPTDVVDNVCKENGWTMLANDPELFDKFSNKLEFYKLLEELIIKRAIKIINFLDLEKELDNLFAEWGEKIVIQLLDEGGGRGTFFFERKERQAIVEKIKSRIGQVQKDKPDDKKKMPEKVVASKFLTGPALSITACITRDNGILSSYSQYQLIDIKEVTAKKKDAKGVFCGHDWCLSVEIPAEIHQKAQVLVEKIGLGLEERGLLGIFGLDFIWDKETNEIVPLEINPRLLGTFPTAVYVHLEKKEVPLVAFHVLDFLQIPYKIFSKEVFRKEPERKGAHLLLFNPVGGDIESTTPQKGGVYKLENDKLKWVRLGFELVDLKEEGEFVLTEGVPVKGLAFHDNGKVMRIITKQTIAVKEGLELNEWTKKVVKTVYREFDFKNI